MEKKKIKVYMGLTTMGNVIDSQVHILREIADVYKDHVELVYPTQCVRRMFHDFARNMVVEDFLATDCDILWFLDSDVSPMKHVLDLVTLHLDKWKLAGATYPVFMNPPGGDILEVVYTAYKKNEESGSFTTARVPKEGQGFIDGLATGCLFIKREVFSQLEKPYFEFKFKPDTRDLIEGEDLGFIRKVNALGLKFFTDYSLVCRHQKSVDLFDVNNYAIQYANRQVLAYDASIKANVENAITAAYNRGVMATVAEFKKRKEKPAIWTPSQDLAPVKGLVT